jgi:ABC-type transport system involved in cytochrome bd biosynthesis fused ATPase/permease subunit
VVMTHMGRPALAVEKLNIAAGEKIAVVGPIGAARCLFRQHQIYARADVLL